MNYDLFLCVRKSFEAYALGWSESVWKKWIIEKSELQLSEGFELVPDEKSPRNRPKYLATDLADEKCLCVLFLETSVFHVKYKFCDIFLLRLQRAPKTLSSYLGLASVPEFIFGAPCILGIQKCNDIRNER